MQQKVYTIRDSKGEFYGAPFTKQTHGEAERTFHQLKKDDKTPIFQYPEDFDLYYIGEFDNLTGKLTGIDTPQHMIKAVNLPS